MTTIAEVRAAVLPVFREMLHERELASLRLEFLHHSDDLTGPALADTVRLEEGDVHADWWILNEWGMSRALQSGDDPFSLARAVQSDLQDFIAESEFGWGEFRGPRSPPSL